MLPGGPLKRRAAVHFAVCLPDDTGRSVSGSRTGSAFMVLFVQIVARREGRAAYRSANNVICIYEEVHTSYLGYVEGKARKWELFRESPNKWILDCVREDRLGVTREDLWPDAPAHETIRLTSRGEVRRVSRDRSQGVETDRTFEPSQEEGETLALLPGPSTVTLEERAFLSEVALPSLRSTPELE